VDDYKTEEEQVEALKKWWDDNGKSTVFAVVIGVAGYFGFNAYQDQQAARIADASSMQSEIVNALQSDAEDASTTAKTLANNLLSEYSDLAVASQTRLALAKILVDEGDLDGAATELKTVSTEDNEFGLVASYRLAKVRKMQERYDDALAALPADVEGFSHLFQELRGDILVAKGDIDAARIEYNKVLNSEAQQAFARKELIKMKLNQL